MRFNPTGKLRLPVIKSCDGALFFLLPKQPKTQNNKKRRIGESIVRANADEKSGAKINLIREIVHSGKS